VAGNDRGGTQPTGGAGGAGRAGQGGGVAGSGAGVGGANLGGLAGSGVSSNGGAGPGGVGSGGAPTGGTGTAGTGWGGQSGTGTGATAGEGMTGGSSAGTEVGGQGGTGTGATAAGGTAAGGVVTAAGAGGTSVSSTGGGGADAGAASCPELTSPPGGVVSVSALTSGASATYSCNAGYDLSGTPTRTCQTDGTWSGAPPTCTVRDCGALTAPLDGTVSAPDTTYSATATYSCDSGYDLSGSATRTCQASGTWSGTAPTCIVRDCGVLPSPANGTVSAPNTTYSATATYSCSAGFSLSGAPTRTCQANGTWSGAAPFCRGPSCQSGSRGAGLTCGPSFTDDCCASPLVTGGTFNRDNNANYPATVSDFRLDKYEITVGRFRAFVTAGMGTQANPPLPGTGENPHWPGSGWDSTWNTNLVAAGGLAAAVQCNTAQQTWTGNEDNRPMNCITWYEAFAFCIWDGGRLSTELEWNYAAAGGNEQRLYAWGNTAPGADATLAVYGCYYGAITPGTCTGIANIAPVGSAPAGNGRWGQADLAGNLWECNLDWYTAYPATCNDCINLLTAYGRVSRGGIFYADASILPSSYRSYYPPLMRDYGLGARCARSP
jgi:sulfatase modifying factor 1